MRNEIKRPQVAIHVPMHHGLGITDYLAYQLDSSRYWLRRAVCWASDESFIHGDIDRTIECITRFKDHADAVEKALPAHPGLVWC